MKKSFKFMLLGLLAMGSSTAFAQRNVGDIFPADAFVYRVTATMDGTLPGEVTLIGIRDGFTASDPSKALIQDGALVIPNQMSADLFGETYTFNVTALGANALQKRMDATGTIKGTFTGTASATKIEFPAHITVIPANCFNGWTNVNSIKFATGSELETINNYAFATTQITSFDFSPCSQLAALPDEVFVEAGKTNTYITSITLPEDSKLLKDIQGAFKHLPNLTEIKNLEKSSITQVIANAFDGDKKLKKIELPGTVQTIAANAFKNCGVEDLTINVDALQTAGDAATQLYGTVPADLNTLKKLTLKGNLGGVITTNAFKDHVNLATLNLSGLNFASKGQIASNAFEGCNNANFKTLVLGDINDQPTGGYTIEANAFLNCNKIESVTFGKINSANAINGNAFNGCTKLASVTIGDVLSAGAIGDGTNPVFGVNLKTVKIGTVKAGGGVAILAKAFKWADVADCTLEVATGTGQYLSSDDAATPIFAAGTFDFSAVINATAWVGSWPVVTFGEIRSKGGVFAGGDLKGVNIVQINFNGDIAQGGLDQQIYDNGANAAQLRSINFKGDIAMNGIEANAFANLATNPMSITFSGSLAKEAIMNGAFELLAATSRINLYGNPEDPTVNPFQKNAFDATTPAVVGTARDIFITISNAELKSRFQSATKGLTTDGAFDVYRVKFYVAPIPADNSFLVYRNNNDKKTAWARIDFSADKLSATLNGGVSDLKIKRVQTDGGTKYKLTLYATYTDEDDALNASTIYMVPLKVTGGFYHIAKTDNEIIIAKAEKVSDFSAEDVKVPVDVTGYNGANESLWPGLNNTELFIAQNIMTNQQLIDKTASDGGTPVDIYRGTSKVVEDLYIMSDPAKHNGFRIAKTIIEKKTDGTGAYINEGWYYMLLKHYNGAPAAARVVWMDDAEATGIFGVKEDVKTIENNVIYNLKGMRISEPVKGQIYIQNGKKFLAK